MLCEKLPGTWLKEPNNGLDFKAGENDSITKGLPDSPATKPYRVKVDKH